VIVAVGAWRGAGATTTALLLAASLAADGASAAWLIEADPAGGTLAGRMQLAPHTIGGLERVAFPSERCAATDAFAALAHGEHLRIVTAPADPFRAFACHQPRMPWVPSLRELDGPVVVDVGRLRAGSPVGQLLSHADHVLVVTAPETSAAVSAVEWLQAGGRVSPAEPGLPDGKARLVVVDSPGGVAFGRTTLVSELGSRCAGWMPWDPAVVDLVHRGAAATDRRVRRSPLAQAISQLLPSFAVDQSSGR
jgi:MinD-like ATPase involved in chromosome partitioning or flagellar assembly